MIESTKRAILFGFLAVWTGLHGQDDPSAEPGLTSEQDEIFDRLLERETRRAPEATALVEEDPSEAAALVEEEDGEPEAGVDPVPLRPVGGTFLQPSRDWADDPVARWRERLSLAERAGLRKLIVQWSASGDVAFFEPAPPRYAESYPLLNRLFEAAEGTGIEIVLGLGNDPRYWEVIQSRADVLDVYFHVRNTRNMVLQEALLEAFGDRLEWTGYYLSEEIDDVNWREPERETVFRQYLLRSGRILRERDEARSLSISSFFRKRTAPAIYAANLRDLVTETEIDRIWIQDGIGVELLSTPLIEPYYAELRRTFLRGEPRPGVVVELFEQTSAEGETFAAQTAPARRIERQLRDAAIVGGEIVVFSLFDYAYPSGEGTADAAFDVIRRWNSRFEGGPPPPPPAAGDAATDAKQDEATPAEQPPGSTEKPPAKEAASPEEAPPPEDTDEPEQAPPPDKTPRPGETEAPETTAPSEQGTAADEERRSPVLDFLPPPPLKDGEAEGG